ncbi:MAG: DUF3267 domain-containing protein [Bdellovibrionales bacterium]|nr:DUF3267 domain-containing protein [Bdellovibrionales bacterium]
MKFYFNELPVQKKFYENSSDWVRVLEPDFNIQLRWGMVIGFTIGFIVLLAFTHFYKAELRAARVTPVQVGLLVFGFFAVNFIHEIIHLVLLPHWGFSEKSIMAFIPKQGVLFVAHLEGITRWNYLLALVGPLFFLSIVPLGICMYEPNKVVVILAVANLAASGGDMMRVWVIYNRVPKGALVRTYEQQTYHSTRYFLREDHL